MKKIILGIFIIMCIGGGIFYTGVIKPNAELLQQVRSMKIKDIDTTQLEDGIYQGNFLYSSTNTVVETEIKNGKIINIKYLEMGKTKYALKAAKEIKEKILTSQKNNVDIIAGASTTSKAILKAVEDSLNK